MGRSGFTGPLAEFRHSDAADRRAVVKAPDHFLKISHLEFRVLAADLDEQFLDALSVALAGKVGPARRLHLGKQLVHRVHVLIIGDRQSRPQVMRGFMIPRMRLGRDPVA